jgi:TPR repeat protein
VGYNFDNQEPRTRWWILITGVIVLIVVAGGYFAWRVSRQAVPTKETAEPTKLPRMANLPPKKEAPKPVPPPYSPDAPLLEQVREVMRKGIDPEDAVVLAKSLPQKPERADAAFILLEYAAEAAHAEAALIVARYFDPTSTDDSGTIIKDPAAAYEWYQVALSGGQSEAQNHLSDLRQWVQKEAEQGSREAREVLTNWQ